MLPLCDQHGVYKALSRRCRHGRKSNVFASQTIVSVVWVTCKQCPAAQWSGPRRCSCPCAPQACALLPGPMWLEADWRTLPSTCNQHQRRRQYLGIQHVLPRTGVLALTTGLPAEAGSPYILYIYIYRWSNFPTMQLTWHHGSTLNLVNRTSH